MLTHNKPFESLADGIALICTVTNIAEEGDHPRDGLKKLHYLPFDYKTVGLARYIEGRQEDVKITSVISVPYRPDISTQEIAVLGETQYHIWQVQYVPDTRPPTLKLSLERITENYEFENPKV